MSVRPAGPAERFVKWVRRNPVVASFSFALFAVALLGFAGVTWALLKAEERGTALVKANDDLNHSNDELTKANDDLVKSRNSLDATTKNLALTANDLVDARETTEARRYLSNVALAHQMWKTNDLLGMRAALGRCPADRMQWEWDYLRRLSSPELAAYTTDSLPIALAYSPDGKRLAYLSLSGTLAVHVVETGRASFFTDDSPTDRNRVLAFRPDSKELAFAMGVRVWVVSLSEWQVKELILPKKPDGSVVGPFKYVALGYTKDGRLLGATETTDGKTKQTTITIRDVIAGTVVSALPAWEVSQAEIVELAGAAFSPDGTRFAASAADSGIRVSRKDEPVKFEPFRPVVMVWEIESKKLLVQTSGSSAIFGSVAFSPDSRALGFGGRGLTSEHILGPGGGLFRWPGHTGEVLATAFDDKNNLIWSGGEDKFIRAQDRITGDERFILRGCTHSIVRLAVSPDGKEVAAAMGDFYGRSGAIIRFDAGALAADTWRSPATRNHPSSIAALDPDGSRFAASDFAPESGLDDGRLVIHDIASGAEQETKPTGRLLLAVFRPDGGLVVLDHKGQLRLIDANGKPGKQIPLPEDFHRFSQPVFTCTPGGKTVAVVGGIEVKPKQAGDPIVVRWAAFGRSMSFQVQPSALRVSVQARLVTWDVNTNKPGQSAEVDLTGVLPRDVNSAGMYPTAVATDHTGKRLAATFLLSGQVGTRQQYELRGVLVVWDLATGKEIFRRVTEEPLRAAGFDPEGRVVAAGGSPAGGVVLGWDIATGAETLTLRGHTRPILAFAFGPGGRLATGGLDRVVKLWDVASRQEIMTLDGFAREVMHVAFTKDGHDLVAATGIDLLTVTMAGGMPTEWPAAEVRIFHGPR